jgi:hypothetical protein
MVHRWRESWLSNVPVNGDIVDDPFAIPYKVSVRTWCIDGATVTRRIAIAASLSRQQPRYLIAHCMRPFEGGLTVLHQVSSETVVYLTILDVHLWPIYFTFHQYFLFHVIRINKYSKRFLFYYLFYFWNSVTLPILLGIFTPMIRFKKNVYQKKKTLHTHFKSIRVWNEFFLPEFWSSALVE